MNIVFFYSSEISPNKGGVQRVTFVLANYFRENGHKVFYISLDPVTNPRENQFTLPCSTQLNAKENVDYILSFVRSYRIDVLINQSGLGGVFSNLTKEIKNNTSAKIITVIHNSLLGNLEYYSAVNSYKLHVEVFRVFFDISLIKRLLKLVYVNKYRKYYQRDFDYSDRVVLLSDSFYDEYKEFVKVYEKKKLCAISNPCTISFDDSNIVKKNQILFVGRINRSQKKIDYLVEIWSNVAKKYANWELLIIGDGEDKLEIQQAVRRENIPRIRFLSSRSPQQHYLESKIFCLTSAYEGFGLVLVEAQKAGAVPIAFKSFPSVTDIINDGENGLLIEPFDLRIYEKSIVDLIENEVKLKEMSNKAMKAARSFNLEYIGTIWLNLFKKI